VPDGNDPSTCRL